MMVSQDETRCVELAGSAGPEVRRPALRPIPELVKVPEPQVMSSPGGYRMGEAVAREVMRSHRHIDKITLEKDRSSC